MSCLSSDTCEASLLIRDLPTGNEISSKETCNSLEYPDSDHTIGNKVASYDTLSRNGSVINEVAFTDNIDPGDERISNVRRLPSNASDDQLESASPGGRAESAEHDSSCQQLSHAEMKEVLHRALVQLLSTDSILADLHPDMTHQEVSGLLEVEAGRSVLVLVRRADGLVWQLRVPRDARLHQLKTALRTHVMLSMHRSGCKRALSWRSVWRRHWLVDQHGTLLVDDNATLRSLGVGHKHTISFVKRNRSKNKSKQLH